MPFYLSQGFLYIAFIIVAIISIYAQFNVTNTYKKYSEIKNSRGYTGADVARMLLDRSGIDDVSVEHISGTLTDHYDPTSKVIRLSDAVYSSQSVAALGVAAHETGHAIQHHRGYVPLAIRSSIFPVVNIGSRLAIPLVIIGIFISGIIRSLFLAYAGLLMFTFVVAFQIVTLPVEFDASHRAMNMLTDYGFLDKSEASAARSVLSAAALTYVAAAATAVVNLLRLIIMVNFNRDED